MAQNVARTSRPTPSTARVPEPVPWECRDGLDRFEIAELCLRQITCMTHEELIRVVRDSGLPTVLRTNLDPHLDYCSDDVLRRLAYLARRCCRNALQKGALP